MFLITKTYGQGTRPCLRKTKERLRRQINYVIAGPTSFMFRRIAASYSCIGFMDHAMEGIVVTRQFDDIDGYGGHGPHKRCKNTNNVWYAFGRPRRQNQSLEMYQGRYPYSLSRWIWSVQDDGESKSGTTLSSIIAQGSSHKRQSRRQPLHGSLESKSTGLQCFKHLLLYWQTEGRSSVLVNSRSLLRNCRWFIQALSILKGTPLMKRHIGRWITRLQLKRPLINHSPVHWLTRWQCITLCHI
eukprot:284819661_4